jgi:uncharacterized protein YdaU (DUF1376 family)
MSKHRRIKVDFVALYFRDFLPDMMMMTTEERGAYSSLCFKIYEEGGWLPNTVRTLSSIAGLTEISFSGVWANIKHKFIIDDGEISQKRCLKELQKSEKLIQGKRRAGLKSGEARRKKGNKGPTENEHRSNVASTNENETRRERDKINNTNTKAQGISKGPLSKELNKVLDSVRIKNSDSSSSFDSSRTSVSLEMALRQIFQPTIKPNLASLQNLCAWCEGEILAKHWGKELYKRVIDLALEAKRKGRNKYAFFFDLLRREIGYVSGKGK